jgi:hypothetical protein
VRINALKHNLVWSKDFRCNEPYGGEQPLVKVEVGNLVTANLEFALEEKSLIRNDIADTSHLICPSVISFDKMNPDQWNYTTFSSCKSLQQINIPDKVTHLRDQHFSSCSALKQIDFSSESELKNIEYNTFKNCTALEDIVIPQQAQAITRKAFSGCSSLTSVTFLGDKIEFIDATAFEGCNSLKDVKINCRDLAHFVRGGFKNVICQNVETIEIKLPDTVYETAIKRQLSQPTKRQKRKPCIAFLTTHCRAAPGRTVIFKSSDGRATTFMCSAQNIWKRQP